MITILIIGFVWIVIGALPGIVVWKHNYNEPLPTGLCLLSALAGPIAGVVHLANWKW